MDVTMVNVRDGVTPNREPVTLEDGTMINDALQPDTGEVSCDTCLPAACCLAGMRIALSSPEYDTLIEGGTALEPDGCDSFAEMSRGAPGWFTFTEDCGFLSEPNDQTGRRACTIYDDPKRPRACGNFELGSQACRTLRVDTGVDSFVRVTIRPKRPEETQ